MNGASPFSYQETVRRALRRRADAATAFCDGLLDRLHREEGATASSASQSRLYHLVSFMVRYMLTQPPLRSELRRLVNLDTARLRSPEGRERCAAVETALLSVVEFMDNHLKSHCGELPEDIDRPRHWACVQGDVCVSALLAMTAEELRQGRFSTEPDLRFHEYKHIVERLAQPRVHLLLADNDELEELWESYRAAKSKIKHLLGYEVDYAGGAAAQLLLRIHHYLCPDETAALYDEKLKPLGYEADKLLDIEPPTIEEIRDAVSEITALMDFLLDGRASRNYLVNRLAAYLQLYAAERILSECESLADDKSSKVEERVIHPAVDEFLFSHGYYPLSEAQLGKNHVRPDLLARAPEQDAWFLYELKQSGFGKTPASARDIEAKLREATGRAAFYHERLDMLPGIQPDVYVLCFVKGTADFVDENGAHIGYWHEIRQQGIGFHVRLVNVQPPDADAAVLLVRAGALTESA